MNTSNSSDERRVAIATTTIFLPEFLQAYADNLSRFGREEQVTIYIAGDRKSPPESRAYAERYRDEGIDARFLSIDDQHEWMRRFPELAEIIPENTDNRRNVAFLNAIADGADVLISIDDDNYCLPDVDFVGGHLAVGCDCTAPAATGAGNWFNLCAALKAVPDSDRLYARGFPYCRRRAGTDGLSGDESGHVGVNVGLWLGDPDTDAIGRLQDGPRVHDWNHTAVLLGRGVRSPINTQNTALRREAAAAYYYVRMGVNLEGLRLDRFGDIFSGYFLQLCAESVGDRVRIGDPVVDHRRNQHKLLVDLYHELAGVMVVEDLAPFFEAPQPAASSYAEAYVALSHSLERFIDTCDGHIWTDATRAYFADVARYMRLWVAAIDRL